VDTDTVDYPVGTYVWISLTGRKLAAGKVTGYSRSGKPLVRKVGDATARPVSKVYLSMHPQNEWGG
jgi:hypothetical protein